MKKLLTIIILTIFILLIGINIFPNTVSAEAKPIILSVDVWTNKGGQGQGTAGGSFRVGEQVTLYLHASVECQAKLTVMGPGGTKVTQLSLPTNATQMMSMGVADASDIGMWQVALEASGFNQFKSDMTTFTVIGTTTPKPPSPPTMIPLTPPSTTPPAMPPPPTTTPPVSATTLPPKKDESLTIPIDANTANELLALLALRMTAGQLTSDLKLDADKDGKVTAADARLFLKWAVKKK